MGYLYEARDRANEAIHRYYEGKGEVGLTRRAKLWSVIDERWNNTLHLPIHAAGLYLNPAFSYACGFQFDVEVMDGFLQCVQRMVLTPSESAASTSSRWPTTSTESYSWDWEETAHIQLPLIHNIYSSSWRF